MFVEARRVDGTLRVWEVATTEKRRTWYCGRFVPTLELDVGRVLVTHGLPIVGDGCNALRRAVAAEPCDRKADAAARDDDQDAASRRGLSAATVLRSRDVWRTVRLPKTRP
jgi:hypothetical protein